MGVTTSRSTARTLDKVIVSSRSVEPVVAHAVAAAEVEYMHPKPQDTARGGLSNPSSSGRTIEDLPSAVLEDRNEDLDDMLKKLGGSLKERTLSHTLANRELGVQYEEDLKKARSVWRAKTDHRRKGRLEPRDLVSALQTANHAIASANGVTLEQVAKRYGVDEAVLKKAEENFTVPKILAESKFKRPTDSRSAR